MKNYKKAITTLMMGTALLSAVCMTGCTVLTEAKNNTPSTEESMPVDEDAIGNADAPTKENTAEGTDVPTNEDITGDTNAQVNGDISDEDSWKAEFEKSLWDNYGVKPNHYEELEEGIYQVYVEIDGRIVPYVVVNSATGDYHG